MGEAKQVHAPGGAAVHYRTRGSGERSLVLVHGWMTSGAVFDDLAAALDLERFRLVVPDLVGTGASERPETGYSLMRYAADVLAVIEDAGLERTFLVGHSMGGQIAQLVAAALPEVIEGLVLINPVPLSGAPLPDDAKALFRSSAGDADKQGTIFDLATTQLSPESRARLVEVAGEVDDVCIVESFDAWTAGTVEERLRDITAPTLVIATDDPFLPRAVLQAEVADKIAGARLHYLAGPGHYPIVETPGETAAVIEAFLAELG